MDVSAQMLFPKKLIPTEDFPQTHFPPQTCHHAILFFSHNLFQTEIIITDLIIFNICFSYSKLQFPLQYRSYLSWSLGLSATLMVLDIKLMFKKVSKIIYAEMQNEIIIKA